MMRRALLSLLLLFGCVNVARAQGAPAWTGIIDPSRAIDWRGAGCCINISTGAHFAIPTNRTQCQIPAGSIANQAYISSNMVVPSGNTDVTDANTINQALQFCNGQPGTYLLLGPGKFYIVNGLTFGGNYNTNGYTTTVNNITLRGSGPDQTILQTMTLGAQECGSGGNTICISGGTQEYTNNVNYGPAGGCQWTAGYAQGSTTLTLANCVWKAGGGFPQPGQIIVMDQRNDDVYLSNCTSSGTTATCTSTVSPLPAAYQVGACVGVSVGIGSLGSGSSDAVAKMNVAGYYSTTFSATQSNPTGSPTAQPCVSPITAVTTGPPATFSYTLPGGSSGLPPFNLNVYTTTGGTGSGAQIALLATSSGGVSTTASNTQVRAGGTGYSVNDVLTLTSTYVPAATGGAVVVTAVGAGGAVSTVGFSAAGTGYSAQGCATAAPTTQTSSTTSATSSCTASVDTKGIFVSGATGVTMPGNITNGRQCPDVFYNGTTTGRPWMTTCQGSYPAPANGNELSWRSENQTARVATSSGATTATSGTITIDAPGVYATNYRAENAPGIYWFTMSSSAYRHDIGVESLTIDGTYDGGNTSGGHINISRCYNCWFRNLRTIAGSRNHFFIQTGAWHITVRDSYFYGSKRGGSQAYAIELFDTANDLLAENNMLINAGTFLMGGGTTGTVFSYNFSWNDNASTTTYQGGPSYPQHDLVGYNLLEGNDVVADVFDNIHGTTWGPTTFFRERLRGAQVVYKNNNLTAFKSSAFNRFPNVVGSVLGTFGLQTPTANYQVLANNTQCGNTFNNQPLPSVYCTNGDSQNGNKIADDLLVGTGMMRWGNYDTVSQGVRWCGTGSETINTAVGTTCQSVAMPGNTSGSEMPPAFPLGMNANAVPASHSLPNSFYLSAKPSWFTTKFGTVPFPAVGPDITGGTAPDGTCWPGDPAHPMLVAPPVLRVTPCTDPGTGMANAIPVQLVHANIPLDTAFDHAENISTASWNSSNLTTTYTGTFTAGQADVVLIQGVSPAGYNGTFQVVTASYPTTDTATQYPVASAAGGSFPPGTYAVVVTRVNPNGETTQSGAGTSNYPGIPATCGNTPPTGNCTLTVAPTCLIAPTTTFNTNCPQQGFGADATTGWNAYVRRQTLPNNAIYDTSGKFCKQNATPLPYGAVASFTTFIDGMNPATGTCITPPTHSTATGSTITTYMLNGPTTAGTGGTVTAPGIQVFNADLDFAPAPVIYPGMLTGVGLLRGGGKISLSTIRAVTPGTGGIAPPARHPVHKHRKRKERREERREERHEHEEPRGETEK